MPASAQKLPQIATQIRQSIIEMIYQAGSGHPGGSLSITDLLTVLYFNIMNIDPQQPNWNERDYFILSNGHTCAAWYATLAHRDFFDKKTLTSFRQINSKLQGHNHYQSMPGIENTAGSLGQGLSQACGLAWALKHDKQSNKVYCLMSDAEQQEGQTWEAYMFAHKYKLNNLIAFIDRNNTQIQGTTEQIMPLESLKQKLIAFGWYVFEMPGHDYNTMIATIKQAQQISDRPSVIITHTTLGKGISFMENNHHWHGGKLLDQQYKQALQELNN